MCLGNGHREKSSKKVQIQWSEQLQSKSWKKLEAMKYCHNATKYIWLYGIKMAANTEMTYAEVTEILKFDRFWVHYQKKKKKTNSGCRCMNRTFPVLACFEDLKIWKFRRNFPFFRFITACKTIVVGQDSPNPPKPFNFFYLIDYRWLEVISFSEWF